MAHPSHSIVVETGAIVAGANSYVTLDEARAYVAARGHDLSDNDDIASHFVIQACDYVESFRAQFQGYKVSADQSLQFPRSDVWIDGFEIAANTIPKLVKDLQCQVILQASLGVDLMPTFSGGAVTEETVGPITTTYAAGAGTVQGVAKMPAVSALLGQLLKSGAGGGFGLYTVRV